LGGRVSALKIGLAAHSTEIFASRSAISWRARSMFDLALTICKPRRRVYRAASVPGEGDRYGAVDAKSSATQGAVSGRALSIGRISF
jgi:hypothetical protein